MRLHRISADDGTSYFGTPAHIQALPDEYRREVTVQMELLAQGKPAEPIRIPRHELVRAKFMNDEDAKKYMKVPEAVQEENKQAPHTDIPRIVKVPEHETNPHKYDICEKCPFRETAMKLIEKTLEKL